MILPNKITTGANAGGPRKLAMRTRWAARVAQFWRWGHWFMGSRQGAKVVISPSVVPSHPS